MEFARLSTWFLLTGTVMLGIMLIIGVSKFVGQKNIPVISPLATGLVTAWKVAA